MRCTQCETRNPIGNKFCRECGEKLSIPENVLALEEAARAEQERNQEQAARLLTDAHDLFSRGKIEQAIVLAEEAAERLPKSTSAYALLAALYERTGRRENAIAAQERVVELNPDSMADQDRLERLKEGKPLAAAAVTRPRPAASAGAGALAPLPASSSGSDARAYLPFVAAGMVGALVLGAGLAAVSSSARQRSRPRLAAGQQQVATAAAGAPSATAAAVASAPGAAPAGAITLSGPKPFLPPPSDTNADPFASAAESAPAAAPARPERSSAPSGPSSASLPRPGSRSSLLSERAGFSLPPAPVRLIGTPGGQQQQQSDSDFSPSAAARAANGGFGAGGRIAVGPPAAGGGPDFSPQAAATPPAPADPSGGEDRGYIHITIRNPRGSSGGGDGQSAGGSDPLVIPVRPPQQNAGSAGSGGAGDPLARAQSLQSAGRYNEAIAAYQAAIGADPDSAGAAYQGIGLSRQRLGDEGGARTAYQQAISAYQAQANSGHAPAAAQRGIASCRAALEVLGGG